MDVFRWVIFALAALTLACDSDLETGAAPPLGPKDSVVSSITVAPDHLSLAPGQTAPLGFQMEIGRLVTDRTVIWTSSDTTIATVSTAGVVTAGKTVGRATIAATSSADHTVHGTSAIQVVAP